MGEQQDPITALYAIADEGKVTELVQVERGHLRALVAEHRCMTRPTAEQGEGVLVERVARAIAPDILHHFDCATVEHSRRWDEYYPSTNDKSLFRQIARAAIAEIAAARDA